MLDLIPIFVIFGGISISINYWQLGKRAAALNLIIALVLSSIYYIVGTVLKQSSLLGTSAMFIGLLLVLNKEIFLESAQEFEVKIGKIKIVKRKAVNIMMFMGVVNILGALLLILIK